MTLLHTTTFDYLNPSQRQKARMQVLRQAAKDYAATLEENLPDGPDKTYTLRKLREVAMWANVAVTRNTDGAPRDEAERVLVDYPPGHPAEGDLGSFPT